MNKWITWPPVEQVEDRVYDVCDCCGEDIFEGEEIYDIDGDLIHADCLSEYAAKYFANCKEVAECSGKQALLG